MPGGRGVDFEAGAERIIAFGQAQLGMAAAEERGEERAEVGVHLGEGVQQALAAILVERVDAFAQAADGGGQVFALFDLHAHAAGDFGELFVGFHVDRAELVALAAQLGEARVERVGVGDGFFFRRVLVAMLLARGAGGGEHGRDAAFEFFEILVEGGADLFCYLGLAADCGFEPAFGADEAFAGGRGFLARDAGGEFGGAQRGVGFGQRIGGSRARAFGFGDGVGELIEFRLQRLRLVLRLGVLLCGSPRDRARWRRGGLRLRRRGRAIRRGPW